VEEVCASIDEVGATAGCVEGAARVATAMREQIAAVGASPPLRHAPRVVCIEWTDPLMVGGHWVPEMVRIAGGIDVLGTEGAPSRYVSWDQVTNADPEVMILMPCGYDLERTMELVPEVTSRPGFDGLACALAGRVIAVDGSAYFSRPGPRIVHGLEILAAAIRGEPAPRGAAYWNQPATSRTALIAPTALKR